MIVTAGLAGLPQTKARIVLPDTADRMLTIAQNLVPVVITDQELERDTKAWLSRVRTAFQERRLVLHSVWIPVNDESGRHFRSTVKPLGSPLIYRTAGDLLNAAAELERVSTTELGKIAERLVDHVGGSWSIMATADGDSWAQREFGIGS